MPLVISFYTNCKGETGNTVSSIALATYWAIVKKRKTLLISTSLNEDTIKDAFWFQKTKRKSGLFGPNTASVAQNGIEGLDRVIRSNRITPEIVSDYSNSVLAGRLEVLLGYKGGKEQYQEIQTQYSQIISLAAKCYDVIIVDMDKELEIETQNNILNLSDVVVVTTTQKIKDIKLVIETIAQNSNLKPSNTILSIGKYDEKLKFNAKNITRLFSRRKELINTVPYNSLVYESIQEGQIIDLFLRILELKNKDENSNFLDEVKRLGEAIESKQIEAQMKG